MVPVAVPIAPPTTAPTGPAVALPLAAPAASPDTGLEYRCALIAQNFGYCWMMGGHSSFHWRLIMQVSQAKIGAFGDQ